MTTIVNGELAFSNSPEIITAETNSLKNYCGQSFEFDFSFLSIAVNNFLISIASS